VIDVSGKSVVVVGLGASGVAAARLLLSRGARVIATDQKERTALTADALALQASGVELALGGHVDAGLDRADLVVVSPGVPEFPALALASARGVPVIGEVELAVRALAAPSPIVAIGGTNGKSTTTSLVGAILAGPGRRVFVGGNLGEPLSAHVDECWDTVVLEVSSFQMERAPTFRPHVAVLLNITDDHLDRYPSFGAYAAAKGNAFAQQTSDDVAIIPVGDAVCERQARRGGARVATFGPGGDLDVTKDALVDRRSGASWGRGSLRLAGEHNVMNAAAAVLAAVELGVTVDTIREALSKFEGLPHRMSFVRELAGVRYYDDSKGTNVGAAVTALRGLAEPCAVLIAGGRDKGGTYAPLVDALRERGRGVVVIGEAAAAIRRAIGDALPVYAAATMDEAVVRAAALARAGDAVLLSPACSSYDMYKDYKHRGDEFVRAVRELSGDAVS
jgi:UDP-N-acetylmuramoylalanine--D-glutamate ligase